MDNAIEVRNLVKRYITYERKGFLTKVKRIVEALKGIDFDVKRGEIFGLLGPNGAGKTTTVKIISTLLLPDGGYAKVLGYDVVEEASEVRKVIGVSLSVERGFFWKLTGRENLKYFGMLYGLDGERLKKRVEYLLDKLGLKKLGVADKLYEEYSLGMKARLSLARALLLDPEVLILDEPTLGLDPPSARALREFLVKLAHEFDKTVLVTTHNMFEAEMICDRVAIIDEGRILSIGSPRELKLKVADNMALEILILPSVATNLDKLVEVLREKTDVTCSMISDVNGYRLKLIVPPNRVEELTSISVRLLHKLGCSVRRVEVKEPTLEDVFIKITGKKGF
ncbi:MAG: ABC transporter ATP-binding protein [Thermoprotei archaeon]|nr:MAG: ABC transporter ATP-binding protein [Thermoprotei archaeon]